MANSTRTIDEILTELFAAINDATYGTEGNGQGYDVKLYGIPQLTELLESLGLITPASDYTLQQVYDAVEGFHYNEMSNFATFQRDILSGIQDLIIANSPVISGGATAAFSVDENTEVVTTITATDPQIDALTYSIIGGADAALFQIDAGGVLSFKDAPDFESPLDVAGGSSIAGDNIYDVIVQVSDGGQTDTQAIAVTVTDENDNAPVITTATVQDVAENTTLVAALTSTDVDTVGFDTATFTITGGADGASFGIVDGDLVFLAEPDFETDPHSYEIEVTANDGDNTTPLTITVNLINDPADDPPEEGPFYLNNDEGVTTFTATEAPDIFVYDFSQADRDNDSFTILNFDSSEDTFIYTNADNPLETTQINYLAPFHVESEYQYTDREGDIAPYPYGNMTVYNISASQGQYFVTAGPIYDPNMDGDSNRDWGQDTITIYTDGGTHRAPISKLDYLDDSTAPIASDEFAHVYQGDPVDLII